MPFLRESFAIFCDRPGGRQESQSNLKIYENARENVFGIFRFSSEINKENYKAYFTQTR